MRRIVKRLLLAVLFAVPTFAQSNATGNWIGTYSLSVQVSGCSNRTFTASGAVSASLLQSGSAISGRIDLADFLSLANNCTATTAESTNVIVGTLNGTAISLSVPNDSNGTAFTGTLDGTTISLAWTDANGATGTITLTRGPNDAPAGVNIAGSWTGTYSFTDQCSNGKTVSYSGAMDFGVTQSGANAGGVITLAAVPLYDQNCNKITSFDVVLSAGGTVSGSTFAGGAFDPYGSFEFPFSAGLTASTMNGTVAGANTTNTKGTFTLTRSDTTPPPSDQAGTYEGTYTEADNESVSCFNIGILRYQGAASLAIAQAGDTLSGLLTFHDALDVASDGFGNCVPVNVGDSVLPVYGTLSNGALTLDYPLGNNLIEIKLTIAGDTIDGTIADSIGDQAAFTVARTSSGAQPRPRRRAAQP